MANVRTASLCTLWILFLINIWIGVVSAAPPRTTEFSLEQRETSSIHESGGEEHVVIVSSNAPHLSDVLKRIDLTPEHSDVRYIFNNSAFRGFSARMKSHCLGALINMGDVLHVEKNVIAKSFSQEESQIQSTTWGLQRISSSTPPFGDPKSMSYTYTYASNSSLGNGVDIYVVDTGINVGNILFGGRARMGYSSFSDSADHDGHGTHVSGTAGGYVFGVAPGTNIIGVKVLGDDGSGSTSDTLAGMDYVVRRHDSRKSGANGDFAGSIMSMSWGLGAVSSAIQTAITSALSQGVHVSMAAGNAAANACQFSPSAAGGSRSAAMSVGSIGPTGTISSFSNTGPCVDIYAPGEDVLSAWIGSDNVVNYLSGTSMATPHVTGVMAYFLGNDQTGTLRENPAALKKLVLSKALRGVVQSNDQTVSGDNKLLLNNGMTGRIGSGARLYGRRQALPMLHASSRLRRRKYPPQQRRQTTYLEDRAIRRFWNGKMPPTWDFAGSASLRY